MQRTGEPRLLLSGDQRVTAIENETPVDVEEAATKTAAS